MITIDCSIGEGGGQIIRTGLSLSCILQKPVKFVNIRSKRPNPGLQAQHLQCVIALEKITNAKVNGAHLGSNELIFTPGEIQSGKFDFNIGTAGSTTLLAQCILPVLIFVKSPSEVTIIGGTHVPYSPPFPHMRESLLPLLKLIGVDAKIHLQKCGFYPVGKGKVKLEINPSAKLKSLNLTARGSLKNVQSTILISNLPFEIAHKEEKVLLKTTPEVKTEKQPAASEGNYVWISAQYANVVNVFSGLGKKGKSAEEVAKEALNSFENFERTTGAIEEHLADQVLLYCALARQESQYSTSKVSSHLQTNASIIEKFLPNVKIEFEKKEKTTLVKVIV